MQIHNEQQDIENLQEMLLSKCSKINQLFPNLESQSKQSREEIEYAFSIIIKINNELDNLLIINSIENSSHEGMKQLQYIFNNIIDKNNQEQINKLNKLLTNLKTFYKLPTSTVEEIQTKYNNIKIINEQIDEFQNEISCKTLSKKPQNT